VTLALQRLRARPVAGLVLIAYAALAAVELALMNVFIRVLPVEDVAHRWPDHPIISPLGRWDTGWYFHIAEDGYFYSGPGVQSAVGFFPGYPALVRLAAVITRDTMTAAVLVSFAAGAVGFVLLHAWARDRFDTAVAWWTVGLAAVFPFAFYLFGVAYAESLFLAACVGAFLLLERDRPMLAGLAGAIATFTRPVGVALVIGLALRATERRGGVRNLRPRDGGVLLSAGGITAFCAYLWWRFDDPLAYTRVKGAVGWNQDVTATSLLKLDYFRRIDAFGWGNVTVALTIHAVVTIAAIALLPLVVRRLGWSYAIYSAVIIAIPLVSSTDFLAMGRYLLPAFPVFAVAAQILSTRPRAFAIYAAASSLALGWLLNLFARWHLIA